MQYRILDAEEWDRLKPLFSSEDRIPRPELATCAVAADDDGEILGMVALQVQLHLEPLRILNPKVDFRRLFSTLMDALHENSHGLVYYACIKDPKVARIASIVGMEPIPYELWQGKVN